jgi:hypothetical protein
LQRAYGDIKKNLTAAAEKMPAGHDEFKPSSMPEVRTFGKLFGHVANAQFGSCAAVKGVPNPNQGQNQETNITSKAEFTKALADSFAFCDEAFLVVDRSDRDADGDARPRANARGGARRHDRALQ